MRCVDLYARTWGITQLLGLVLPVLSVTVPPVHGVQASWWGKEVFWYSFSGQATHWSSRSGLTPSFVWYPWPAAQLGLQTVSSYVLTASSLLAAAYACLSISSVQSALAVHCVAAEDASLNWPPGHGPHSPAGRQQPGARGSTHVSCAIMV